MYEDIGLKGAPFQDVTYLYPVAHEKNSFVPEDVYKKHKNKFEYTFDYKYDKKNLDMLFLDIDDDSQTMGSIIDYVNDGAEEFSDENMDNWEKFLERVEVLQKCEKNKGSNNGSDNGSNSGIATVSWRKFFRHIKRLISKNDLFSSLNKEEDNKKQTAVEETRIGTVINDIKANHVYVIDIAKLDSNMQAFVFGTTIKEIMEYKLNQSGNQSDNDKPKKIIIFMDELNKYAPAVGGKNSLICQQILEIAERGRSLGIILFGAEQFMSGVHYRVTGNCATFVYGKTNANELSKAHYKYIPPAYQHMMSRLKAGECILQNVCLSSLLRIKFPKPIYEELT